MQRAAALYREGLALLRATGDRAVGRCCLEGLAAVAVAEGQSARAARLYGAGATQRRGTFVLHVWDDRVARDRQIAAVRAALGDAGICGGLGRRAGDDAGGGDASRVPSASSCTDASHSDLCPSMRH